MPCVPVRASCVPLAGHAAAIRAVVSCAIGDGAFCGGCELRSADRDAVAAGRGFARDVSTVI